LTSLFSCLATSCGTPTSTIANLNSGTSTSTAYTYTASFTGTAVLEFGFHSTGNAKIGYLDDVSIVDTNASNSEMLINGGFENGSLVGWQTLCTSTCTGSPGNLSTTSCHTGSYCYADGCQTGVEFLRQIFTATNEHIYTLSFWITVANTQSVYVEIF
jgi:hypothetical protein